MAVRNTCPECKKRFSAPEEYVGRKIECPRCGSKVLLRSDADILKQAEHEKTRQRQLDEDERKIALIERMEERRRWTSKPYYEEFGTGVSSVRHFNPAATSRFLRFRALSEILTFSAYVVALLVMVGIGLTVYLKLSGTIPTITLLLVCLIGWALAGTVLFLTLKFLGELAFALSEVGDQQNDVVQLLLDVRENTEPSALEESDLKP